MQAYKADTAWNRGIPCIFFKILIQLYLLRSFLYSFTYFIKEVINGKILWRLNLKVLAYEAATAWNRGIPFKISTFIIKLYLVLLNWSKRLLEVRSFVIKWICRHIRQIHPETRDCLVFFQHTNWIIFVTFVSLFFDLLYQRDYQW